MYGPEIRSSSPQQAHPQEMPYPSWPSQDLQPVLAAIHYPGDNEQLPDAAEDTLIAPPTAGAESDMREASMQAETSEPPQQEVQAEATAEQPVPAHETAAGTGALALRQERQKVTAQIKPSAEPDAPQANPEGKRAWARGEARQALITSVRMLTEAHEANPERVPSPESIFARSATIREYLPLLMQPELKYEEIAISLGEQDPEYPVTVVRRALMRLYDGDQVPAELKERFPQPTGPVYGSGAQKDTTIGGRLATRRVEAGVSIEKLAEVADLSESATYRFLSGKVLPPIEKVSRMMGFLGIDPEEGQELMRDYVERRYKNPERREEVLKAFEIEEPDPVALAGVYKDQWLEEDTVPDAASELTEADETGIEETSEELPEGAFRFWAKGQQRTIVQRLSSVLESTGKDPASFLPPRSQSNMRALLPLLRDPDLTYADMESALRAQGILFERKHMSVLLNRICERLIKNTPSEQVPEDLSLQPQGPIIEERTDHAAAPIRALLKESGITYGTIAEAMGKSTDTVRNFMNGISYPRPSEMLVPICRMLGMSEDDIQAHVAKYIPERQAHTTRRRT